MAKSGFIGVLKDTALKLYVRWGYEPLSLLNFVSIFASQQWEFLFRIEPRGGRYTSVFKGSVSLPICHFTKWGMWPEPFWKRFNNKKNSDQISFSLSTVEHSFKLNKISFLQAFYWIESLLSLLWNLFDCRCIIIPCKCITIPWHAHPLLCWEQNRTWQIRDHSMFEPLWNNQCELLHATKVYSTQVDLFLKKYLSAFIDTLSLREIKSIWLL